MNCSVVILLLASFLLYASPNFSQAADTDAPNGLGDSGPSSDAKDVTEDFSIEDKFNLITRNLQSFSGESLIKDVLKERELEVYWGVAPTGRPHVGYLAPLVKIRDLVDAGCKVTILFADLHAFLKDSEVTGTLVSNRLAFYEYLIKALLKSIGVPEEKINFVVGTDFQLEPSYTLDMYRQVSIVTEFEAEEADIGVITEAANPFLGGLLYPILEALDEEYLGVDAELGGEDQVNIYAFAEKNLPKLGYKKRAHLVNPMLPGLFGGKMSCSDQNSKIDLLDSQNQVEAKVNNATDEWVLDFYKYVLLPLSGDDIVIAGDAGDVIATTIEDIHDALLYGELDMVSLKSYLATNLSELLLPVQQDGGDLDSLIALAYPPVSSKDEAA